MITIILLNIFYSKQIQFALSKSSVLQTNKSLWQRRFFSALHPNTDLRHIKPDWVLVDEYSSGAPVPGRGSLPCVSRYLSKFSFRLVIASPSVSPLPDICHQLMICVFHMTGLNRPCCSMGSTTCF